ncbi:hypothetical protein pVco7_gp113 [Vibrio phage pVco-7]|uniref:Uncharacterized protein n=1 Tax=Vibrio phage pVco-5 TaxID=1965485 RepID=A0A1W6JV20_9CAUD|nr:hypothetical protein KNT61_gp114 [Vibrio phage pVco-5]ARM71102.1 hypothetical protein pVco5_113 [Vibrio phage pVco-5]
MWNFNLNPNQSIAPNQPNAMPVTQPISPDQSALSSLASWGQDTFNRGAMFGDAQNTGWVAPSAQAVGALANAWTGFQQIDLMKNQLDFQKEAFNKNFANQRTLTNQALYDRARARSVGETGRGLGMSQEEFTTQYGVN